MLDVTNVKKIHWQKYIGPVGILANLNVDHLICWPWIRKKLFSILQIVQQANDDFTGFLFKIRHSCARKSITKIHGKRAEGVQCNGRFSLAWKFWREWVKKIGKPAFKSPPEPENVGGIIAATAQCCKLLRLHFSAVWGDEGRVG